MASLGDLFVTVGAKIEGFERAMGTVSSRLNQFDKDANKATGGIDKMFGRLEDLGKGMTAGITLPLGAAGAAALAFFGDFESSMNRVSAVGDITGASLDRLKNFALEMGAKTKFSAKEAADGMGELAAKGFNAEKIIATLPGVLSLAAVESMSVADAAKITTNALNNFGLEATKSGHVADVLAKASADSSTNVSGLGNALEYVGPIAHSVGMSFEETTAALALLSNNGLEAERAGTGLRGVLASLVNPSADAAKSLEKLGVATKDAHGNMLPLPVIMDKLKASGATAADMMNIFGRESATAAQVLAETGSPALTTFTDGLVKADGDAKRMADTINRGWKGALEQMSGSVETAAISLGEILAPAAIKVAGAIQSLADWISGAAQAFRGLPAPVQLIVGGLLGLAAVAGPLVLTVGLLGQAFTAASGGLIAFGGILGLSETAGVAGALSKLPGLARLAGVALLDNFVSLPSRIPSFATIFAPLLDGLKAIPGLVATAASSIGPFLSNLGTSLAALANTMKAIVVAQFAALSGAIANIAFAVSNNMVAALTVGEKALLALGQAALMAAAAFIGWKIGSWLYENVEAARAFGDAIADLALKIPGLETLINRLTGASNKLKVANDDLDFATGKLEEALKRKGIVVDKTGKSVEQYRKELQEAAKRADAVKKPTDAAGKSTEELAAQFASAQGKAAKLSKEEQALEKRNTELANATQAARDANLKADMTWNVMMVTVGKLVDRKRELFNSIVNLKAQIQAQPGYIDAVNRSLDQMATSLETARLEADALRGGVPQMNDAITSALGSSAVASDAFGAALGRLKVTSATELSQVAADAKKAYDAVTGSGIATQWEKDNALLAMLRAQAAAAKANGETIPKDAEKMMRDLEAKVGDGSKKLEDPFKSMKENISRTIYDLSADMVKSLFEGDGSFAEKGIKALKSIGEAVVMHFVGPATEAISKFIATAIADLLSGKGFGGVLQSVKDIGTAITGVFKDTPSTGSGSTPSVPSGGGGGGGAGGGDASGAMGVVNLITGIATAVSSIIGNFQMYAMNKSLDLIEKSTRYTEIYLHDILTQFLIPYLPGIKDIHGFLYQWTAAGFPEFIWQKLDAVNSWLESLKYAVSDVWGMGSQIDRSVNGVTEAVNALAETMRDVLGDLAAATSTGAEPGALMPGPLAYAPATASFTTSVAPMPVSVQVDGREIARSVVHFLDDSGRRV